MSDGGEFNTYFARLGALLGNSRDVVSTLVIHPLHSAYLRYRCGTNALWEYDEQFLNAVRQWQQDQLLYHFGDETLLKKYGSVENGILTVGKCEYTTVLLPYLTTIDSGTAVLLQEFMRQGGNVCILGGKPSMKDGRPASLDFLHATVTYEEILRRQPLRVAADTAKKKHLHVRLQRDEKGLFLYAFNDSERHEITAEFSIQASAAREWLLAEERFRHIDVRSDGPNLVFSLELLPSMSKCIRFDRAEPAAPQRNFRSERCLANEWAVDAATENVYTLDRVRVSVDGNQYEDECTTLEAFHRLLTRRYRGDVLIEYSFVVDKLPTRLKLVLEKGVNMAVTVNGYTATAQEGYRFDPDFALYDILQFARPGRNTVTIRQAFFQQEHVYYALFDERVTESLRNCLTFDTELENAYLVGDFGVYNPNGYAKGTHRSLVADKAFHLGLMPERVEGTQIVEQGFPFFSGRLRLSQCFDWDGIGELELCVDHHCAIINIYVNDQFVQRLFFEDTCDLTPYTKIGSNTLQLVLITANRNVFGPFHHPDLEPYCVGPEDFGEGDFSECPEKICRDQYAFAELSIRSVAIEQYVTEEKEQRYVCFKPAKICRAR